MRIIIFILVVFAFSFDSVSQEYKLDYAAAEKFSALPLECIKQEYPYKLGQVLKDSTQLQGPRDLHPIFYGCFDWHSSVHGHWLLVEVLNRFPETELAKEIEWLLSDQFTVPKAQAELLYFQPKLNKSFERTYGWAWLLQLQSSLLTSKNDKGKMWANAIQPLVNQIENSYMAFLPKMVYPIRVGEHTNTAFGLTLALDYARATGHKDFEKLINASARNFYEGDKGCPLTWEPSGFDFISPCLQEAELMSKVLPDKEFEKWFEDFMPCIFEKNFDLEPGKVLDRTDGKLVHLDGLNFSRAWCLYGIAAKLPKMKEKLIDLGDKHLTASMDQVVASDYMGSHWLASFLVYALVKREMVVEG